MAVLVALNTHSVIVHGFDEWPVIVCDLLDNAIEYSENASTVFIALQADEEKHELQLSVTNTVAELDENDLPHLFERLWRKDTSRTSSLHCGLGLALVKACATRIGASVDCQLVDKELSMLVAWALPGSLQIWIVALSSLVFLALLGGIAARVGGAPVIVGAARVTFWGLWP